MGINNLPEHYQTLKVRFEEDICFLQMFRPEANNTINDEMINEMNLVVDHCYDSVKLIVLEGLPEVFCFGADFKEVEQSMSDPQARQDPGPLYDLWLKLSNGPFISVAHVQGKANAGGIGFVAACDIVLCQETTQFSLSELLFGLMPACVLPFLVRRMGFTKANFLTLSTQPIGAKQAQEWGLVDAFEARSENLLRKQLLRLRRLSKTSIERYKRYMNTLDDTITTARPKALAANLEVFNDRENLEKISRYVNTGRFPWE